jgi:hypothetical protein
VSAVLITLIFFAALVDVRRSLRPGV